MRPKEELSTCHAMKREIDLLTLVWFGKDEIW